MKLLLRALLALTTLALIAQPAHAAAQDGPAVDAGSVEVVDPADRSRVITEGASATIFTVKPPDGATCPGDSASDQWRVSSFIIPSTDDPGQLVINALEPEGEGRWPLFETTTRPFINEALQRNEEAGQPARILEVPPLSFGIIPPGTLPEGRYTMGLVCSRLRISAKYWDVDILLTEDPSDEPGQMTWEIVAAPGAATPADDESRSTIWLIGGLAVLVVAAGVIGARTVRSTETTKEQS